MRSVAHLRCAVARRIEPLVVFIATGIAATVPLQATAVRHGSVLSRPAANRGTRCVASPHRRAQLDAERFFPPHAYWSKAQ
jgi:hypothetical protein